MRAIMIIIRKKKISNNIYTFSPTPYGINHFYINGIARLIIVSLII